MPRRGENIYHRKDGRWEARFIIGHKDNGKAIYKSVYARSYQKAKAKRMEAMRLFEQTLHSSQTKAGTVASVSQEWLAENMHTWKESTLCRYKEKLRIYILPMFGDRELSDISTEEVAGFITKIQTEGIGGRKPVAPSTAALVMTVLNHIRLQALKNDCPVRFSPECIKIKRNRKKVTALSEADQKTLISKLKEEMDAARAGILACLFTGIRIGELCALNCDDIDLENHILHIRNTMQRLPDPDGLRKTRIKIDAPKSKSSIRDIPFGEELADIFRRFHKPGAFFLTGDKKRFMEPRTMENRFASILEKCALKKVNFHVTRHSFATRCIERGMDAKTLSEILGHASVSTTLDLYVHLSMKQKTEGMALLSDLFAV